MTNVVEVVVELKNRLDSGVTAARGALDRLGRAFAQREREVLAFNKSISNGDVALRQWAGLLGSVLSVAKLNEFAGQARAVEAAVSKLSAALARRGQSQFLDSLKKQADELEKKTNFDDKDIIGGQTLLISLGASAEQAMSLIGGVLDYAELTESSVQTAATQIGKLMRGEQVEMGRFKIDLDQSKNRVDALREALARMAAGTAAAAVADRAHHEAQAEWENSGEALGAQWVRLTALFQGAFLPAMQQLASFFESIVTAALPFAASLAGIARTAGALLPWVLLLVGSFKLLHAVINPLRTLIVLFSGRTLTDLSLGLATCTQSARGLWSELKNGGGVIAGVGSAVAAFGSILASAFAGWEAGKFLGGLEVFGRSIADWNAIGLNRTIQGWVISFNFLRAALDNASAALAFWWQTARNPADLPVAIATYRAQLALIRGELAAANAKAYDDLLQQDAILKGWADGKPSGDTTTPIAGTNTGLGLDPSAATSAESLARKRELFGLETDLILARAAGDQAEVARLERQKESLQLSAEEKDLGADIVAQRRAALEFQDLFNRSRKAAAFEDETAALAAQVAGDQREMDRLDRLAREKKYREELAELGRAAEPIVQARIAAEDALTAKERVRTEQDRRYNEQLAELQERRTLLEQNRLITQEEKERRTVDLLTRENQLIAERIALLEREKSLGVSDERRGQIDNELHGLRSQSTSNSGAIAEATPIAFDDAPLAGAVDWLDRMQTRVESIREAVYDLADAFAQGVGRSITGLIKGTMTWSQALSNIGTTVIDSIIGSFARMAANWITQQIIMALFGNAIRAAQLAAIAPVALATAALWAPAATAASIATMGGAAVTGAAAAQIAIWSSAAGFREGGYTGDDAVDAIAGVVHGREYVFDAASTSRLGVDFLDSLRSGGVSSLSRPAYSSQSSGGGFSGGAGGDTRIAIGIVDREASARQFLDSSEGRRALIKRNRRARIYNA